MAFIMHFTWILLEATYQFSNKSLVNEPVKEITKILSSTYSDGSLLNVDVTLHPVMLDFSTFHPKSHSAFYVLPNLTIYFLRNVILELE